MTAAQVVKGSGIGDFLGSVDLTAAQTVKG